MLLSFNIVNADIVPALGLNCTFSGFDYIAKMLVVTMVPIALSLFLLVAYHYDVKQKKAPDHTLEKRMETLAVPKSMQGLFEDKQEQKLRKVFASFDVKGVGTIDETDLKLVLKRFTPNASEEDAIIAVSEMVSQISIDGDLEIDFGEFLYAMYQCNSGESESTFASLVDLVSAKVNKPAGQFVINIFLVLTFLILLSTSTTVFHYLKCHQ